MADLAQPKGNGRWLIVGTVLTLGLATVASHNFLRTLATTAELAEVRAAITAVKAEQDRRSSTVLAIPELRKDITEIRERVIRIESLLQGRRSSIP